MELLRFSGLDCHYGSREVFTGVDGVLNDNERIGLVGPNGAGKSSLLRLLVGVDAPFGGSISRARDARCGYLAQSVADETQATLQELVDGALARTPDAEWGLQNKRLRAMLDAFGFESDDFSRPLREFSGGQRAKAALAHLLIDDPAYMVLDEPTNHLDIRSVRWLESFIASDKRSYVIVSHDRYFLDRVATRIWELDRGTLHVYAPAQPAYTSYVEQRTTRLEAQRVAYETAMTEREKRRATIAGLRATHTSSDYSQVRSREKQLAKLDTEELVAPDAPRASIRVRLDASRRATGGFAFEARGLSKAYAQPLFSDVTFEVESGSRLAIVGPNGAGKSTLLKILAGEGKGDSGNVRFNPAASPAYFAQSAPEQLDPEATAVDAVLAGSKLRTEEARGLLGRMRITGEMADRPVRSFSGGERRRIMLARLMARRADILLLDEPTNDLDIESRDALESVLDEYAGAVVIVSHDRYLLNRLSDRVLWIENGDWGLIEGGYDAYERYSSELETRASSRKKASRGDTRLTPLKQRSLLATKVARIERDIEKADARKAEIDALFEQPELYEDRVRVKTLQAEREELARTSADHLMRWEEAAAQLERLKSEDLAVP